MFCEVSKKTMLENIDAIKSIDSNFQIDLGDQYYLLYLNNKISGYAITETCTKACEIKMVFIEDEKRHNNLGTKFLRYIESIKEKKGIEILWVCGCETSEFFQKAGFKRKGEHFFYEKISERKKRFSENSKIIILSIVGNIILAFTKISVGISGRSRALLSDGINSLSDVATSTGMYIGVYYSNQPADEAHPYGHEKIESVIANILGILMILTAFELGRGSVELLYSVVVKGADYNAPLFNTIWWGVFSAIVKYAMYYYKLKVGKQTMNHALIADAKDSRNDIFTSLGAVLGILLAIYVNPMFDILLSIPVAVIIFKEGIGVIMENANLILDKQDKEFVEDVEEFIYGNTEIKNVHDIKMRSSGDKTFLSLHIRVPKDMTVNDAHYIADDLEEKLYRNFDNVTDVLIHVDPIK